MRETRDSYSSAVIKRILRILLEHGSLNKSRLAKKAGINYSVCIRYISFLLKLNWIQSSRAQSGRDAVSISGEGIDNLRRLESELTIGKTGETFYAIDPKNRNRKNRMNKPLTGRDDLLSQQRMQSAQEEAVTPKGDDLGGRMIQPQRDTIGLTKKKILVVDDDELSLSTYGAYMEREPSYEVTSFSDSKKALDHLTMNPRTYDLIILDIRMPEMSGLRLYQGITALNPEAQIIFLSSLDIGPELSDLVSYAGVYAFLKKPITRYNFLAAVRKAVSS